MYTPKTNSYKSDIGTFKMLLGVPMRVNLCSYVLNENGATSSSVGNSFTIIEGYMYEFEAIGDSDIADYLQERSNCVGLQERWELFGLIVSFDRREIIEDAYHKTRDDVHRLPDVTDDDEKKSESSDLKAPLKKPSKAKN